MGTSSFLRLTMFFFQGKVLGVLLCVYSCAFVICTMGLIQIVFLFMYSSVLALTLFFQAKGPVFVLWFSISMDIQTYIIVYLRTILNIACFVSINNPSSLFYFKKKMHPLFCHAKEWVFCFVFMDVNL